MTHDESRESVFQGYQGIAGEEMYTMMVIMSGFFAGHDLYLERIRERGQYAFGALRKIRGRPLRLVRRLHLTSRFPGKAIWFEWSWRQRLNGVSLVIVHAAELTVPIAAYIVRKHPKVRVILWHWNPIVRPQDVERARSSGAELWSFDADDCDRYDMRLNTTYSFHELSRFAEGKDPTVDMFFFGSDKGRSESLIELAKVFDAFGLTHRLYVVPSPLSGAAVHASLIKASAKPYEDVLSMTGGARAIVDIVQDGQYGMTLRSLEAVFLGRKLITNSVDSFRAPFYHPDLVFYFPERSFDDLPAFLSSEIPSSSRSLASAYDFSEWVARFDNATTVGVPGGQSF